MSANPAGSGSRWIPAEEYEKILALVPIVCVDVMLVSSEQPDNVGLIYRDTYDGGRGWCLVGGALLRDEPFVEGVRRHVEATLGSDVQLEESSIRFHAVFEYFTEPRPGQLYDPRKNAVALTYSARAAGIVKPQEEALDFRWFGMGDLDSVAFGFGQERVVEEVVRDFGRCE
jgi:ADP-ribose pyrophosphatase YjhB (NUDIX family)